MKEIQSEVEMLRQIIKAVMYADILTKKRDTRFVNARLVFAKIMRDRGYNLSEIGRFLGKHHATIIHYLNEVDNILMQENRLMEQYLMCNSLFYKQAPSVNKVIEKSKIDLEMMVVNLKNEISQLMIERQKVVGILEKYQRIQPIIDVIETRTPLGKEDSIKRKIICMFNE
jgi:hypothetical protein